MINGAATPADARRQGNGKAESAAEKGSETERVNPRKWIGGSGRQESTRSWTALRFLLCVVICCFSCFFTQFSTFFFCLLFFLFLILRFCALFPCGNQIFPLCLIFHVFLFSPIFLQNSTLFLMWNVVTFQNDFGQTWSNLVKLGQTWFWPNLVLAKLGLAELGLAPNHNQLVSRRGLGE